MPPVAHVGGEHRTSRRGRAHGDVAGPLRPGPIAAVSGADGVSAADAPAAQQAAFERSMAALSRGDVEGHLANCTDDFVLEMPYADPPAIVSGKAAVRERLTGALGTFVMQLTVTDAYPTTDPDVWVFEYDSEGRVTTTGKPYANRYIAVVHFRGGQLCRHREYFNPVPAARALAD